MENILSEDTIITLGAWLETPAGGYVRAWEQACLNTLTADIFGYNAVQIGLPQINALDASRMPHKWLTDTRMPPVLPAHAASPAPPVPAPVVLLHDFAELPFATQSLDLVILPHVLEFAAEPHQVLREVERVLIPEGQVIVCGFNPASLWGARQAVGRVSGRHFLPQGEFIGLPRLKDWLKLLNMGVTRGHHGCYAPPFTTGQWLKRSAFMEQAGARWWPYFGAVYVVQAIKRVKGMHLIGPAWSSKSLAVPQGAAVTNKSHGKTHGQD
jgi:SAM-dependent methyltransferase